MRIHDRTALGFMAVLVCFCVSPVNAQISLSQDFDSGSLDVAASTVSGSTVDLVARKTWVGQDNYRWVYFKASNVLNDTPQFRIDNISFRGSLINHKYVYSYDQLNWNFFDNGEITGSNYEFSNNSAFTQNEVYVAYGLPYPVSRTDSVIQTIKSSPFVSATSSSDSNLVIGQSAAGIDDVGRFVPAQNLYGFKITDSNNTGAKQKVLLSSGSHSAETPCNFALEGLVDFLLSDDDRAVDLRTNNEFYVYPQTNPAGRFGGYYRSNPENPDKDFNRFFDNPAGFTDLAIVTSAMKTDTNSDVDILIDFHSWWGPWIADNFVFVIPELVDDPFLAELELLEPGTTTVETNGQPGMLRIWGSTAAGLNSKFSITPEIGFHPDRTQADLMDIGRSYGIALSTVQMDPDSPFSLGDVNRDNAVNFLDIGPFIAVLSAGDFQQEADIDQNEMVNFLDIAPFINLLSQQ